MQELIKKETEKVIQNILEQGLKPDNVDYLYKLIDIHKDVANEQYWEKYDKEEEPMRYNYGGNYHTYGRRRRDSQGRFMEGVHGEDMINEVYHNYGNYSYGKEQYGRGNYGAKEETIKSLDYMLQSVVDFMTMLREEAGSQEELELIKKYSKKISEM